ncbi:MAG TPA: type II secretion system F family protein [Ramlibacter sp.]|uniref:type II secretion system F family protein n=1 Tax=Ramlibacter sp. TaxID=1917967 RepID=UPI002D7E35D3|nr:type II secretion system F family protein [Ramlibacter sp.]HET8746402.1 type II secretion system F family protein [Ramlibacter sp.]
MDLLYYAFLALCFLAVVALLEGLYLAWNAHSGPEAQRIARRIQSISAAGNHVAPPLVRKRVLSDVPAMQRLLLEVPRIHALDRFLLQSGVDLTVAQFLLLSGSLALGAVLVATVLGAPAWALAACAVAGALLCAGYVQRRRLQRMRRIDQQLPDALDLMARAMQAGHAFSSALHLAGTEGPQPIAAEFLATFDEINFGVTADAALTHLATRVASKDLRFFVVATLIQRETGGNLAEILQSIAELIRGRQRLVGTVRVLSAEGRLSAWVLSLLPFGVLGAIVLLNPGFAAPLWTDPAGIRLVSVVLVLMLVGLVWMWRMVRIRI